MSQNAENGQRSSSQRLDIHFRLPLLFLYTTLILLPLCSLVLPHSPLCSPMLVFCFILIP